MDGGFDGFEVLRSEDEVLVAWGVTFGQGLGEDGGVLVSSDIIHDRRARAREVPSTKYILRTRACG